MKAITISIFLTLVGFSLTGLAGTSPVDCPVGQMYSATNAQQNADTTSQYSTYASKLVSGAAPAPPSTTLPLCVTDPNYVPKPQQNKECAQAYKDYGKEAGDLTKNSTTSQQKAQDDASSIQDKVMKLQNQLTDDTNKTKEDIQNMQEKYQSDNLKRQQDAQSAQMSIADKIREQTQQISEMNGKLQVAQVQLISVQNSYTATVNANNVSMVRMKCMSIIRKWMKDNSVGATIKGSIGNSGNQQLLLDDQWNSCIATEQANSQATVSNAQAAVTQAQANISSLQTALQSANSALAQMNAASTQQNQMATQASQIASTSYQQKMQNAQTKMSTAQIQTQQQIMQLNLQAVQKSQLAMTPQDTNSLNGALNNYKANCCNNDTPNWGNNPDNVSGDDQTNACTADPSTQNLANNNQNALINSMAPALMNLGTGVH